MPNRAIRCAMKSGTEFIILPEADQDIDDILQYTLETWEEEQDVG